jgi:hypothetical protein
MSQELSIAMQARVPVLLWGSPGTGKTSQINALSKTLNRHVECVIASIREPADFGGLPVLDDTGVYLHAPAWAHRLALAGDGILFIDEISTAAPATQAALLRVVLDRVVGDLVLPASTSVVAAANPPSEAAGGWDLSPPMANRFCHLHCTLDPQSWVDGMMSGFSITEITALPIEWENKIPESRSLIASFIKHRPYLLLQLPVADAARGMAWPSPRSWDMAARLLAACKAIQADDGIIATLLSGCVGDGPALEFLAWQKTLDLPDPETLLANAEQFKMPERGDQAFAVLAAVVSVVTHKLTEKRWKAAWTILARAAEQGGKDIAAVACKTLVTQRKGMPLPVKELQEFVPLLQKGGLL